MVLQHLRCWLALGMSLREAHRLLWTMGFPVGRCTLWRWTRALADADRFIVAEEPEDPVTPVRHGSEHAIAGAQP
jgi:hypothetical protein